MSERNVMETQDERQNIHTSAVAILSLLEELERNIDKYEKPIIRAAAAVEHMLVGRPQSDASVMFPVPMGRAKPMAAQNILSNLVLSWSSLIVQNRPAVYATATTSSLDSAAAAQIATKIIEYMETEEETASKIDTSALYAAEHGTGIIRICYDQETERVCWSTSSVFDTWIQKATKPDDVQYCVFIDYLDKYTATDLILKSNPDYSGEPAERKYYDGNGYECNGVPKFSIWYRPCARFPTGLHACVIDESVTHAEPYPYVFQDQDGVGTKSILPVVWWTCRATRNGTLGTTWAFDVYPIQQALDILNDKLLKAAKQTKNFLCIPKSLDINEGFLDENYVISVDDSMSAPLASVMGWLNPGNLDPNLINERQNLIGQMYDTAGITPATAGSAPSTASGKSLAYQAQLDSQKHASSFKNLENCISRAWDLTLKLIQKFYTSPRTILLADGQNELAFTGADIQGVNVRLEPRSSRESMQSTKTDQLKQDTAAGLSDPAALQGNLAKIQNTPQFAAQKMMARQAIEAYKAGQDISQMVSPQEIAPEILVSTIDEAIQNAYLSKDITSVQALQALKQEYILMAGQQQQAPEPAGPAAKPAPEGPAPLPEHTGQSQNYQQEAGLKTGK